MSQIEQNPAPPAMATPIGGARADGDDPLAHLHKMSTTAGLGSADYVAVSGVAIFCVVTGVASALALMDNLLLVLPLTALVAGVYSLRQISRSNGTQTGKGLVALGMICALLFGGFVIVRDATAGIRTRADRQVIGQMVQQFGEKIKSNDFTGAYAMFSDHFHQRVTQKEFNSKLKPLRAGPMNGKLLNTTWNGLASFGFDGDTAVVNLQFSFENNKPPGTPLYLRKTDQHWYFDDMPYFFPPAQTPAHH